MCLTLGNLLFVVLLCFIFLCQFLPLCDSQTKFCGEHGGLVVNASDSGSRGPGFKPHSGQTVLCP